MEKIVIDQLGVNEERTPLTFQLAERLPHIISGDPTAHDSGGSTGAGALDEDANIDYD